VGVPSIPTVPGIPSVSLPLPSVSLPGTGSSSGSSTSPPLIELPIDDSPIEVCIPGALEIGDC
jgi:hypothetical protein